MGSLLLSSLPASFYLFDLDRGGRLVEDVEGNEIMKLSRDSAKVFFLLVDDGKVEFKGSRGAGLHYAKAVS